MEGTGFDVLEPAPSCSHLKQSAPLFLGQKFLDNPQLSKENEKRWSNNIGGNIDGGKIVV